MSETKGWQEQLAQVAGQAHSACVAVAAFTNRERYHDSPNIEECNGPSCVWYRQLKADLLAALKGQAQQLLTERDEAQLITAALLYDVKALVDGEPYDHERISIRRLGEALAGKPTDWVSTRELALQAENAALRSALGNIWRIAHNRKGQANEYITGICEAAALKAASLEGAS